MHVMAATAKTDPPAVHIRLPADQVEKLAEAA
jgi:hypothetical protein